MAEALLRDRLAAGGVSAMVRSAGELPGGAPASSGSVRAMAARGVDLSPHRSETLTAAMLASADLVVTMARRHLRTAVAMVPETFGRTFTLRELVRRGATIGPRRRGEPLEAWLARLHEGRTTTALLGGDDADDVADPIGGPDRLYEATAYELELLMDDLFELVFATAADNQGDPMTTDTELFGLIEREIERQNTTLQLIASENFASLDVLRATGSVLTNKYSEGYPGKRYYGGNEIIDEVETLAIERVKALFGAEWANVQPHSGSNANLAVYFALLEPGDTVLGLRLDQGGHLTHGNPNNASGKLFNFVSYGVTPSDERIDFDQLRDLAIEHRPKMIVAGATAYPRTLDAEPFRSIADEVGALFMFDAAHIAGLIAGGVHPNPVPIADVVTFTTHKTLRGPRGGCIVSRTDEFGAAIDKAVMPGMQGGPLDHVIAAKAVGFFENAQPSFREYAASVVRNAAALAEGLAKAGHRLVSGGTDTHLMLVDLRQLDPDLSGRKARNRLGKAGISLNENTVPDDPRPPYQSSGLRIGTAAATTAGMAETEMLQIAELLDRALRAGTDDEALSAVRDDVAALCSKFQPYPSLAS